ncbi:hypothetical protein MYU51_015315 [Penicillium brevicompactum]|uniref:uncharacterized protein n=1 Tax=Penicillium brevicompactum TaxID=5074 RepID=UPI00253FB36E|nr:uncharacterized protein N7506_006505 [Penicillium brevicompactum]KAJ5332722.1 hypothetical protein N7506_006505 [Penicillium brevicompactum]
MTRDTQAKIDELKGSHSSVEIEYFSTGEVSKTSPKQPCSTRGHNQAPLLDGELMKPRSQQVLKGLAGALNDLASEKKCTRCTVEDLATQITGHVREMREAKRNGEWTKEERKAMKAEFKAVFKPMKKEIKALWKAN